MSDEVKPAEGADGEPSAKEKSRTVTLSGKVKVIFEVSQDGGPASVEEVESNRDIFSVMDAIGSRLSRTGSKEEFDGTLVSVHSLEDPERSDPLPEGSPRWEGDYLVGGVKVEKLPIADAMNELAKGLIPNDACLKGVERLAEQLFLRSRLDGFVFVGTFDGVPAVVPLVSSFKEQKAECFAMLYRQLHLQAENLKAWVEKNFPDIKVNWTGSDGQSAPAPAARGSGLVRPDGTPVDGGPARPLKLRVPGLGCGGKSCRRK